jgi:hypothetical protein
MAQITHQPGPMFKKLMEADFKELISRMLNSITRKMKWILQRWTPVGDYGNRPLQEQIKSQFAWSSPSNEDDGNLKQSYKLDLKRQMLKAIKTSVHYWIYIVKGHRVLTTDKARRWFFGVFLKMHPEWKRKVHGSKGFVPANPFHRYALNEFVNSGQIITAVKQELKRIG